MIRETLSVGLLQCNCTILGDEVSREAIVIDPGDEIPRILAVIQSHSLNVRQIIVTHAHIDHIAGALALKYLTGAPVSYSQHDSPLVAMIGMQASLLKIKPPAVGPPDHSPEDEETIQVQGIAARIHYTPGHSPGSLCVYVPEASLLLSGDTLFYRDIGRFDLPGGHKKKLLRSIRERIFTLPGETLVVAGHGSTTTIADEQERNPILAELYPNRERNSSYSFANR